MIKLLVVNQGVSGGVPFYRTLTPHTYLQEKYPDRITIDILEHTELKSVEQIDGYDILFFHRHLETKDIKNDDILKYCKEKSIKVIVDIDDSYEVPMSHPAYGIYKSKNLKSKILNNFKSVDLVTTTTSYFKSQINKFRLGKPTVVLENAIDPNWSMFKKKKSDHHRVTAGWIGGSSHKEDIKILNGLTERCTTKDVGTILFGGFDTRGKKTILHPLVEKLVKEKKPINLNELGISKDELYQQVDMLPQDTVSVDYEKILSKNYELLSSEYTNFLKKYEWQQTFSGENDERYKRVWTKKINKYAEIYNQIDISLAPLVDNHFNRCKSQLKVIEAGFHKIPIIAQNIEPYQIDVVHGENGYLVNTKKNHKDWVKLTKRLINSKDLRDEMGQKLYETVSKKYTLDIISKKRLEIYEKLVVS